MAKKNKKKVFISDLKSRGWTKNMIKKYLPAPQILQDDKNEYTQTRYWLLDDVEAIESSTDEFKQIVKQREQRKRARQLKIKEKEERIALLTSELNVRNPALDYPLARSIARHFILNVGETNTGKTYQALQALKKAKSGTYLAPLRLLAMEVQDRMLDEGISCSMVTGEEENIIEDAKIMSSTVEKIDLTQIYEVGVIDECQMIADDARGGSWTRAILGLAAETIYLCMSPDAEKICKKLIDLCGDTYEVNKCVRNTELIFDGNISEYELKKNDAVILFSRKKVLQFAENVKQKHGLVPSVVYGALPYKSRKQQVELYNTGKTDIIIATDAIGMGMNLPIKRVVFAEVEKFDGDSVRNLYSSEIKQIAGRAGRMGIFDQGYVVSMKSPKMIGSKLKTKYKQISRANIPFPHDAIQHSNEKLSNILREWSQVRYPYMFIQQNVDLTVEKVLYLEKKFHNLSKETMLKLATVMFDEQNDELYETWKRYVFCYYNNIEIMMPTPNDVCYNLKTNEQSYKELDLYYSFHKSMDLEFDYDELMRKKEHVIDMINQCLLDTNKKNKQFKHKKQKYKNNMKNRKK